MKREHSALPGRLLAALGLSTVLGGCATQLSMPCVQYETVSLPRMVSMRGQGAVFVEEEMLTCTRRIEALASTSTVRPAAGTAFPETVPR